MSFKIVVGNIVDDNLLNGKDAFVLPTNPKMRYGMGVSEVAFRKAGIEVLEKYCEEKYDVGYNESQFKNDMIPTEVRVTPGFGLGMDIIFAQSPNTVYFNIEECDLYPLLFKTYENIFSTIVEHKYHNVIMPSLGTGHYGFDHEKVAKVIVPMVSKFSKEKNVNVTLCLIDDKLVKIYESYLP